MDEDLIWIDRTLSGDTPAFGYLVEKYQHSVYTISRKILLRDDEAADAAQTVFVKAFQSLAGFNRKAGFGTWISRIAYNHAIGEYRKKRAHPQLNDERVLINVVEQQSGDTDQFEKEAMLLQLEKEIEKLDEEERALITLFYLERNSVENISAITGLTVSNVKTKMFRIRNKLKEKLLSHTAQVG